MESTTHSNVQEYYGQVLKSKNDLQTSACCVGESVPKHLRQIIADIHPEIKDKFYGCGSPIPDELKGKTVLDLGCGTGRDCYLISKLVGQDGFVIGVDMTDEQIDVAKKHIPYHTEKFGYSSPNVSFRKGYIEDLAGLDIKDNSVDVVISNCVINLSPDKMSVFKEIFRVLKPGGELYFSDVFSDRRIPAVLKEDPVLLGECLSGAMYKEDYRRLLREVGCLDFRYVSTEPLDITNPEVNKKIGMVNFYSCTVRAFKLDLEDICENYGHVAYYQGSLPNSPHAFKLDDHHIFPTNMPIPVCGNTANMLMKTRLNKHFEVSGDFSTHFGPFDCAPQSPSAGVIATSISSNACC